MVPVSFLSTRISGRGVSRGFFISAAGLIISDSPTLTALQRAMRVAFMTAFVVPMVVWPVG